MEPGLLPREEPWWQRHRKQWRRLAMLGTALAAMVLTATAAFGAPSMSLTPLYSATHELHVDVPSKWAVELHPDMAARSAAEAGAGPGLLAATDADNWHATDKTSYGVFTTLMPGTRELDRVTESDRCGAPAVERRVDTRRWKGKVWEWPDCDDNGALSAAAVHEPGEPKTVYLEIRQPEYRPDLADTIIDSVRV